jgi:ABC-type multidrug transport system fused ATPase/permease subunit
VTAREAVLKALNLLSPRDRRLLGVAVSIQMATAFLDLAGVLLIGLVGVLAVQTLQSQPPPTFLVQGASQIGIELPPPQDLVLIVAGAAAAVLLLKSIVSSILTRRVFAFLANRQALVTGRIVEGLFNSPLSFVQSRSTQETVFALVGGAAAATMTILGLSVIVATEFALLIVLGIALILVSPWVALGSIAFFAGVALLLQKAMGDWAGRVGSVVAQADIRSMEGIQEALNAYREISVSGRRGYYVERIQQLRWQAAKVAADTMFIGMFPKYMFEAALVLGGLLLAATLFATQDSLVAVGTLALFLAAGTRVMPSLLRLQGALLGMRGAAGVAGPTFDLASETASMSTSRSDTAATGLKDEGLSGNAPQEFNPSISVRAVSFTYPGSAAPALVDAALEVPAGSSAALIGRSGAGKSTLADLVLGVLEPDSGRVELGGQDPQKVIRQWPGAVAYVPQVVSISNSTIRENVALGLPRELVSDANVWEALEQASLAEFIRSDGASLDTAVGERGMRLSGGQRQRIGIARALYTRPKLLVLDEATSALDAETENSITRMLRTLEGHVTTLIIAHRLSTVQEVDNVAYLEHGRIIAQGKFDAVKAQVPAVKRQASLMELK